LWSQELTPVVLYQGVAVMCAERERSAMRGRSPESEMASGGIVALQQTLVIVKPDAFDNAYAIRDILTQGGIRVVCEEGVTELYREQVEELYKDHAGKSFFEAMVEFMTSGPAYLMVLMGEDVIRRTRERLGDTYPENAAVGTIRQIFGTPNCQPTHNAAHASDSEASAVREIGIFFPEIYVRFI